MKNFLNSYSSLIFNFFTNQLAMTFFGFVMSFTTHQNTMLYLLTSVLAILFYCFLIINSSIERGKKDKIRIESGRLENNSMRGLYVWLVANIPNIILFLCILIGKLSSYVSVDMGYSLLDKISLPNSLFSVGPAWANSLFTISYTVYSLINAMYAGVIHTLAPENALAQLLVLIPSAFAAWFGYYAGVKDLAIAKLFDDKKKQ